ncbi:MAG: hypothetical protein LBU21_05525 [Treponema sp.]|jgi:hypothetical protein|nr:hypothetical protein [Treponema sp.]
MNLVIRDLLTGIVRFLGRKCNRRMLYLLVLGALALPELVNSDTVRRTFVFYGIETGKAEVEERMLFRAGTPELDLIRYTEETLLGPVSPDLEPLFPRGTGLHSLLYRDGVVYANLSETAVAGIPGGDDIFRSLSVLEAGIRRNFSFVKDVRLFIAGNQVRTGRVGLDLL